MRITITLFALAIAIAAKSQNAHTAPPQNIQHVFATQFMNASAVTWKSLPDSHEANFIDNGTPTVIRYASDGNILFTESKLQPAQLPTDISQSLKSNFLGFDLGEIRKIEISKEVMFKVVVRKGNEVYEVEFGLSGKIQTKKVIQPQTAPAPREEQQEEIKEVKKQPKHKHKRHKGKKNNHGHDGHDGYDDHDDDRD